MHTPDNIFGHCIHPYPQSCGPALELDTAHGPYSRSHLRIILWLAVQEASHRCSVSMAQIVRGLSSTLRARLILARASTLWARLILAPPLFYPLPLLHLLLFNHSSSIIGSFKLMMTGFALKQNIEIVPVQNILRNTLMPKIKVGEW